MDRIVWSLVALTTIFSVGHHIDHASRHLIGWPLNDHVTPFSYGLGFYVLIIVGSILSRRGVIGPGFWAILAGVGLLFIGGSHYGPFANDPPSTFAAAYGSQTKATFATLWLWGFLLSLAGAMVYSGRRWAMLRRQSLSPSVARQAQT
jgi:hypothetical protein